MMQKRYKQAGQKGKSELLDEMEAVTGQHRKHLVWFHSIAEAVELGQYYLDHDEEREAIARQGRAEVLAHHTWDRRVAELFEFFERCRQKQQ
jgi:spore maturation protein CgeB